jgi:hypothetical protein
VAGLALAGVLALRASVVPFDFEVLGSAAGQVQKLVVETGSAAAAGDGVGSLA